MSESFKTYVPRNVSEIMELLGWMMLASPDFEDHSGYFPDRNADTEFYALNEGFKNIRKKLGEDRLAALLTLSDRARAHFEADPNNETDDTLAGRRLIAEMEDIVTGKVRPEAN